MDIAHANTSPKAQIVTYRTNSEFGTPNQQWELAAVLGSRMTDTQPPFTVGPDILNMVRKSIFSVASPAGREDALTSLTTFGAYSAKVPD
jgi:hypothetical protein